MANFLPQSILIQQNGLKPVQTLTSPVLGPSIYSPKIIPEIFSNHFCNLTPDNMEFPILFEDLPDKEKNIEFEIIPEDNILESNEVIKTFFDRISPAKQYLKPNQKKPNNPSALSGAFSNSKSSSLYPS